MSFDESQQTGESVKTAAQGVPGLAGPSSTGGSPAPGVVSAPAYRSDLPLSTTWFIDPVHGSNAPGNPGTTSATALQSLQELKRRWWNAEIMAATTVTILGNLPSTDTSAWNFSIAPGVQVTFNGSLGPTTGFGGAAVNNTLFTGSVTGFVAASDVPSADDSEMTDTSIPVSFTASGLLAAGVLFQRINGTQLAWYALKDLGAKNIRITPPMAAAAVNLSSALTVGDTYNAFSLWTIFNQRWGAVASQIVYQNLQDNSVLETAVTNGITRGTVRTQCWMGGPARFEFVQKWTNCLAAMGTGSVLVASADGPDIPGMFGGGARGTGGTTLTFSGWSWLFTSAWVAQGVNIQMNTFGAMSWSKGVAIHDCTAGSCIALTFMSRLVVSITSPVGGGISGKGNTVPLLSATGISTFSYTSNTAFPPFNAASTSVGSPITLGATNYTVAALPALGVELNSAKRFPYDVGAGPANGAVTVAMTNAPTGSPAAPVRYFTIPDGAGGTYTVPSLT